MPKALGTIISTLEGPNTGGFSFVVSDNSVRRGQFVVAETENGRLVASVSDIFRANRYFDRPESVFEYERRPSESSFGDHFPASEWEYTVAQCSALGLFENGALRRNSFPPSPGAKVFEADEDLLKKVLQFDDRGLFVGKLLQHGVDARLSMTRLFQKHLAILAMSGAGKSVLASVLIEELLKREKPGLACLVFDVHGEYVGFADKKKNPAFASKTMVVDGEKVRIAASRLTAPMVAEFMPEMSAAQVRDLEDVLESLKKKMKSEDAAFDLDDVLGEITASEMKENVKAPLLAWVGGLKKLRLFGKADYPSAGDAVRQGGLTVFDLSDTVSQKKRQVILAYFTKRFFNLRRANSVPPFLLLVEEAHNFCREKAPRGGSLSKGIIETVAREGRKFGASLCLVSQRPVQLSTTALSQCNTFIILRVTNPYDLEHIGQSCEAIDAGVQGQITTLKVGEGIIIGEAVGGTPVFVAFRNRESVPAKAATLEEMAEKYSGEKSAAAQLSDDDLDAFL